MSRSPMNVKAAVRAINEAGALLVFPMDNRKEPASIWSHFFPRTPMKWEWDEPGDNRVADLWHLRSALSTTGHVVYSKWFRGRATYFSKPVFAALLRLLNPNEFEPKKQLSPHARRILEILEADSPLSTKELKNLADLRGRANEPAYERALKELWSRMLIVAYGEVDDGAFPSLAIGSTRILFEALWGQAFDLDRNEAEARLVSVLGRENLFYRHFEKLRGGVTAKQPARQKKKIASVIDFKDL